MTKRMTLIVTCLIAAVAALAVAPAAQAEGLFEVEKAPSQLSGEQTETIGLELVGKEKLGKIECSKATLSGEISGTTASLLETTPSFSGCTFPGGLKVEFFDNECKVIVHGGKQITEGEEAEFETPVGTSCPEKEFEKAKLEFHVGGCVVSIAAQVSIGDLFIKVHWFALPPDLLIGSRVGKLTAAIENTKGKMCVNLPVGAITLNVYGGLTLHALHSGLFVGLGLK